MVLKYYIVLLYKKQSHLHHNGHIKFMLTHQMSNFHYWLTSLNGSPHLSGCMSYSPNMSRLMRFYCTNIPNTLKHRYSVVQYKAVLI